MNYCRPVCLLAFTSFGFLSACSNNTVSLEIRFNGENVRERIDRMMITVTEPFTLEDSAAATAEFVTCSDIGFFKPSIKYSREDKQLSGVRVYVEREFREFPLGGDWDISLPDLAKQSSRNPWQAMLVYIEARGQGYSQSGETETPSEKTLAAGCTCVRRLDNVSSGNPDLDELVTQECELISDESEETTVIEFEAVVPDIVKLETCRAEEYVVPAGEEAALVPGVCLAFSYCSTGNSRNDCLTCVGSTSECNDLGRVPVILSLDPGSPATLKQDVILTSEKGEVVPKLRLTNCSGSFFVNAQIVGREEAPLKIPVHCVESVRFEEPLTLSIPEFGQSRPRLSVLPSEKIAGVAVGPAQLAVLANTSSTSVELSLSTLDQDTWLVKSRRNIDNDVHFAIHGYDYRRAAAGRRSGDLPMLVTATGRTNVTIPDQSVRVGLSLDVYALRNGVLEHIETMDEPCGSCACAGQAGANCSVCEGVFDVPLGGSVSLEDTDFDGDGYADLVVGHYASSNSQIRSNVGENSMSFAMSAFYSSVTSVSGNTVPVYRGDLGESCSCYDMGFGLNDFNLLRWGGSSKESELWTVDIAFGRPIGGSGQYARGRKPEGPPCDLVNSSTSDCGNSRVCVDVYGNQEHGRCLEPCNGTDEDCTLSQTTPYCLSAEDPVIDAAVNHCGGEGLACLTPSLIWDFYFVRDVDHGRLTTSPFEDAIMVGTAERNETVRVFYGGTHDHTTAVRLSSSIRKRLNFDLVPTEIESIESPSDAQKVAIEDYNGDGIDDVAVLYGKPSGSEQVRIWLGANSPGEDSVVGVRGLGQVDKVIELNRGARKCDNALDIIAHDMNGDNRGDIIVMCRNQNTYELYSYRATAY